MTRQATRVYTDPADIARLGMVCAWLEDTARVAIVLVDTRRLEGIVVARPSLQTFLDAEGHEGTNAVLRLDDVDGKGETRWIWIDEVLEVVPQKPPEPAVNQRTPT